MVPNLGTNNTPSPSSGVTSPTTVSRSSSEGGSDMENDSIEERLNVSSPDPKCFKHYKLMKHGIRKHANEQEDVREVETKPTQTFSIKCPPNGHQEYHPRAIPQENNAVPRKISFCGRNDISYTRNIFQSHVPFFHPFLPSNNANTNYGLHMQQNSSPILRNAPIFRGPFNTHRITNFQPQINYPSFPHRIVSNNSDLGTINPPFCCPSEYDLHQNNGPEHGSYNAKRKQDEIPDNSTIQNATTSIARRESGLFKRLRQDFHVPKDINNIPMSTKTVRRNSQVIKPEPSSVKKFQDDHDDIDDKITNKESKTHFDSSTKDSSSSTSNGFEKLELLCAASIQHCEKISVENITCSCPRSRCIKLYCECFQSGKKCVPGACSCRKCLNTEQESGPNGLRTRAINNILSRNPSAFDKDKSNETTPKVVELMCRCVKSQCLKLYCDCFQAGKVCNEFCMCLNCSNTEAESGPNGKRTKARKICLEKNPSAFEIKEKKVGEGCACKNSRCLKKYCECFSNNLACSEKCICMDCANKTLKPMNTCRQKIFVDQKRFHAVPHC
mmetsp:Transcript_11140/g.15685  ORF Transcript_11140/g.15685 Transcript_11140/m.15685 type:complete len:556 (+) Transcript_11140:186-1853(+)